MAGLLAGPLEGIRVLEFSQIIAAPFAGMLLADMGADVVKVEPPWGEPWRLIRQFIPLESRQYMAVNRGKRSLPLDLARPEGQKIAHDLARRADVAIVNYRPDVLSKIGLDYETLSAENPRLVYCENTAFGSAGPRSDLPGYDLIVQAMSGLMAAEGKTADGVPQHLFSPVVDISTGLSMAWAVCGALYARERTGRGQRIEASLLSTALALQESRFLRVEAVDREPHSALLQEIADMQALGQPYSQLQAHYQSYHASRPGNIYYRIYNTADGVLAVGCLSDRLRQKLLGVLGLRDIRLGPDYDPDTAEARAFGDRLIAQAEGLFREKTTARWMDILERAGVPAHPLRFTEEMLDDDQVVANEMAVDLEHTLTGQVRMAGPLAKMSGTPLRAEAASPALGEHTDEILGSLGYSAERIRSLKDTGVSR